MQVDIAENGSLGKRLTITYSPAEVRSRRDQVLRRIAQETRLPGFRPGKSAKGLIEKRFGPSADAEAERELSDEGLKNAVDEHKLRPVGPIDQVDHKNDSGLLVSFAFEIKPPVTLPDPTTLTITKAETTVGDVEVEQAMQSLARRGGTLGDLPAGQNIAADDSLTLTGGITVGGVEVRALHNFHHLVGGYPLLGKEPEAVIELLKDKNVGHVVSFTTTLPKTFKPEEHAGKEAQVSFTIQGAQRIRPAILDDEFAQKMGVADLPAMREAFRANLQRAREQQNRQKQMDEMMRDLLTKTTLDLPPKLRETVAKQRREAAQAQEKPADGSPADLEAKAQSEADDEIRRYLVLDAIAEAHHIQVTRDDLEHQIALAAQRSGRPPADIAKTLQESGRITQVVNEIREAKAMELMLDKALGVCVAEHVHGPDCKH